MAKKSGAWYSRAIINGKVISCGYHKTEEEANMARLDMIKKVTERNSRLIFVPEGESK